MKTLALLLSIIALVCGGCLKDEVDVSKLTTNPLDPDYTGPALFELTSDSTKVIYPIGQPADTVVVQHVRVRTDLLSPGTPWTLYIVKEGTGEVVDYSYETPHDPLYHHVHLGASYCFTYQLKVRYSLSKAYRFCTTAAL